MAMVYWQIMIFPIVQFLTSTFDIIIYTIWYAISRPRPISMFFGKMPCYPIRILRTVIIR